MRQLTSTRSESISWRPRTDRVIIPRTSKGLVLSLELAGLPELVAEDAAVLQLGAVPELGVLGLRLQLDLLGELAEVGRGEVAGRLDDAELALLGELVGDLQGCDDVVAGVDDRGLEEEVLVLDHGLDHVVVLEVGVNLGVRRKYH